MTPHTADLSDFVAFKPFAREFADRGLGTEDTLRWLTRYRRENGLLSSGAIVEILTPGARRPRLFVNRPKFAAWLAAPPHPSQAKRPAA